MSDPACPQCAYRVAYNLTCHTWPARRDDGSLAWRACMPCDSAIEYLCLRDLDDAGECGWRYTHGLNPRNPRNPRTQENEKNRPPWIPEGQHPGWGMQPVPGVMLLGSEAAGDD
jgi:hypothetical protein